MKSITQSYYVLAEHVETIRQHKTEHDLLINERDVMIANAHEEGTAVTYLVEVTGLTRRRIHQIIQEQSWKRMNEMEEEDRVRWTEALLREYKEKFLTELALSQLQNGKEDGS